MGKIAGKRRVDTLNLLYAQPFEKAGQCQRPHRIYRIESHFELSVANSLTIYQGQRQYRLDMMLERTLHLRISANLIHGRENIVLVDACL